MSKRCSTCGGESRPNPDPPGECTDAWHDSQPAAETAAPTTRYFCPRCEQILNNPIHGSNLVPDGSACGPAHLMKPSDPATPEAHEGEDTDE